ncbi:MAG: deoxyguanosinetriphosphate triphosphohydrolase [Pseudomonadota bacterium]
MTTLTTNELEKRELENLALFAVKCAQSKGRRIKEEKHPYCTDFQIDIQRIIQTQAFRRLEYKTQVFVNHEGDHYRTRLTHSIEVSQASRIIARALKLNEDLIEGLVLAHDIGHTPFGHAGEKILNELMEAEKGFSHNEQSLRVVDKLEYALPDVEGLNLCYELREGIIKHTTSYDYSEVPVDLNPEDKPFLEAQIINLTDVIAFNAHDLDDGLQSGLLKYEMLNDLELWKEAVKLVLDKFQIRNRKMMIKKTIEQILELQLNDLIEQTSININQNNINTINDIRNAENFLAKFSEKMHEYNYQLMDFLMGNLYRHYRVVRMEEKARMIINRLFNSYLNNPKMMPHKIQKKVDKENSLKRIVCDYVAGMTDRYAIDEYNKLFDPLVKV